MLPRLHLFEWEDQDFFPPFLRDALTNYLSLIWTMGGFYKRTIPILKQGLQDLPTPHITDLCSGGGGAIPLIHNELQKTFPDISITLSDRYPNHKAFQILSNQSQGKISYLPEHTDARTIDTSSDTLRTMFLALHHFPPSDVQKILQSAIDSHTPIAIFEIQQRSIFDVLLMFIHIPLSMIVLPLTKPSWKQILCTYIIPIIPLCITWDGIVSTMRTYSHKELLSLTQSCVDSGYAWSYGHCSHPLHSISYFLGIPPRKMKTNTIQS
jgi:hypothetical protein